MKIQKKKSKLSLIIAILLVAGLCAGIAYLYFVQFGSTSNKTTHPESSTVDDSETDNAQSQSKNNSNTKVTPSNTDTAAPTTKDEASDKNTVQMISSVDSSNNTVYIRGGTNSPVPEDGTCFALLIGPSGQSIRKNTTILQNPASTDCKTISIPETELATGEWSFTLNYSSENYKGVSSEARFSI